MTTETPDGFPGRAEIRGLVQWLGPTTLLDLFEGYEIADEDRFEMLEETLGLLVVNGRRVRDLPLWFLETLETRCREYRDGRRAGRRGDPVSDTPDTRRGHGGGSAATGSGS